MKYPFGTSFNLIWQYQSDYPPVGTPTIYVFDSKPTLEVAKAGTGAVETIISWTTSEDNIDAKTITIGVINDPNPNDSLQDVDYYVAINYELESSEQEQTDIFTITLRRNKGNLVGKEATATNIKEIFPEITSYVDDYQLDNFIAIARAQTEVDFKKRGFDLNRVANLTDFWLAMAYKVISMVGLAEMKESGDRHFIRYEQFSAMYLDHMDGLQVEYDSDQDGEPESKVIPFIPYLTNLK